MERQFVISRPEGAGFSMVSRLRSGNDSHEHGLEAGAPEKGGFLTSGSAPGALLTGAMCAVWPASPVFLREARLAHPCNDCSPSRLRPASRTRARHRSRSRPALSESTPRGRLNNPCSSSWKQARRRVIPFDPLRRFWRRYAKAEGALRAWHNVARSAGSRSSMHRPGRPRPTHHHLLELIEPYEAAHHDPIPAPTAAEALEFHMDRQGLTQADVHRLTGISRSHISGILSGRRQAGKENVRVLHEEPGRSIFSKPNLRPTNRCGVRKRATPGCPGLLLSPT